MKSSIDMRLLDEAFNSLPATIKKSRPDCAMLLGSGWSRVVDDLDILEDVPYADIKNVGSAKVVGHDGRLVLARLPGKKKFTALVFCGRRHYYEGVGWEPVIMPSDFCRRLRVGKLLLTNAAGGIRLQFAPGDVVLIRDHISFNGLNPLIGPHFPEFGPRFPDQCEIYNHELSDLMRKAAMDAGYILTDGIYAFSCGPSYETPAEIKAYGVLGADLVGMSTAPEAIVANACGIKVAGLSLVSNMAAGISGPHLSHKEVIDVSANTTPLMTKLVHSFLLRLASAAQRRSN